MRRLRGRADGRRPEESSWRVPTTIDGPPSLGHLPRIGNGAAHGLDIRRCHDPGRSAGPDAPGKAPSRSEGPPNACHDCTAKNRNASPSVLATQAQSRSVSINETWMEEGSS